MIAPPSPSTPSLYTEQSARLLVAALLSSSLPQSTNNLAMSPDESPPQLPMTISIDATTRIMGHGNTIHLPSAERIAGLMTVAMKGTGVNESDRKIEVKVAAGVEIRGCKNVVLSVGKQGPAGGKEGSNRMDSSGQGEGEEAGRKRRAGSVCCIQR